MTPQQFKEIRHNASLSLSQCAQWLGVDDRSIRRYEDGSRPVSGPVSRLMYQLTGEVTAPYIAPAPEVIEPKYTPVRVMDCNDRADYEGAGGWNDGRLGQAADLVRAVLMERGEKCNNHALLNDIESEDY